MSAKLRNYCFTINFTEECPPVALDEDDLPDFISYLCYQEEVGEGGTHHLQGYLECDRQVRISTLLVGTIFGELQGQGYSVRFEPRRGTQAEAIAYCQKDDDTAIVDSFVEFGELKHQGQRSDLLEIKAMVDAAQPLKRCYEEHFGTMIRYGRALKEYKRTVTNPRDFPTITILIVGPSGVGKSRFATELCEMLSGPEGYYKLPKPKGSGLYWDDYDGQGVTFIDEFDGNYMRPTDFNELADRYEYVVPVHGGAGHQFVSKYLIICSNYLPKFWWKKRSATQLVQTTRRIHATLPFMKRQVHPPVRFNEVEHPYEEFFGI